MEMAVFFPSDIFHPPRFLYQLDPRLLYEQVSSATPGISSPSPRVDAILPGFVVASKSNLVQFSLGFVRWPSFRSASRLIFFLGLM